MRFPIVELPEYYCGLLKFNISSVDKAIDLLPGYIKNYGHLEFMITKYFSDINSTGNIVQIIKSIGWNSFRDRLCSLFLYKKMNGNYPDNLTNNYAASINAFEKKIAPYSVNGFGRGFLFSFYLKMARIDTDSSTEYDFLNISEEVIHLLSHTTARVVKIDWLLMLIIHFLHFFGERTLTDELIKKTTFKVLFDSLSEEEKDLIIHNMLAYGASIGAPDIFYGKMV